MADFPSNLKELFAKSFYRNFKYEDSRVDLIKMVTRNKPTIVHYEPTRGHEDKSLREFEAMLTDLSSDETLDLWEIVIKGQTYSHDTDEPPQITSELRNKLIQKVKGQLYKSKNELLQSGVQWGKIAIKNAEWKDYAEAVILGKAKRYKKLLHFLELLEPKEIQEEIVNLAADVTEEIKKDIKNCDLSKVDEQIEIAKKYIEENEDGKQPFIKRLPNHIESSLVSLGLDGVVEFFKKLFGF
ncbi:hypothetical protein [Bacillus mycoides]|uniref:hypothetical protein n=1 Tax=Bacillus mycoides TaxID=1405 RepID=UPI003D65F6AF